MSSESAVAKPFRSVIRVVGAIFDAVYYFVATLFSPGSNERLYSAVDRSNRSSGPRIGTLRPYGGNAPNMNMGCRSCQM